MGIKFVNNSESTLATGIAAGALSLTLQAGHGTRFPTVVSGAGDFFFVTLVNVGGDREVIKVVEHQAGTDVFQTIERAADAIQNGTPTAYAFSAGDVVQCRLPAVAVLTPTETENASFQIDSNNTGPLISNESGDMAIRNAADSAYANLKALGLTLGAALVMAGSITGATSIVMGGTLTGVTDLTMGGTITGITNLTASGALNAATLALSGGAVIGGTSSIPIDNEATADKIKARDHGTGTTPEVVNVVYGTGSPPSASTTPEGTIWLKYIA